MVRSFLFFVCFLSGFCPSIDAQDELWNGRVTAFCSDYDLTLHLDVFGKGVTPAGHELLGPVAGWIEKGGTSYLWLAVEAKVEDGRAVVSFVNDYGSEDFKASISVESDSTLTFKQEGGSPLKFPVKGKWQKMPKTLSFKLKVKS